MRDIQQAPIRSRRHHLATRTLAILLMAAGMLLLLPQCSSTGGGASDAAANVVVSEVEAKVWFCRPVGVLGTAFCQALRSQHKHPLRERPAAGAGFPSSVALVA